MRLSHPPQIRKAMTTLRLPCAIRMATGDSMRESDGSPRPYPPPEGEAPANRSASESAARNRCTRRPLTSRSPCPNREADRTTSSRSSARSSSRSSMKQNIPVRSTAMDIPLRHRDNRQTRPCLHYGPHIVPGAFDLRWQVERPRAVWMTMTRVDAIGRGGVWDQISVVHAERRPGWGAAAAAHYGAKRDGGTVFASRL
jgi:hypothetical protein